MRTLTLAAIALTSLSSTAVSAGELPFEATSLRLKNGLELIMVPQRGSGLIAYYSLVRVGSRDETEKGVTGFAHFFEHMMFRGTPTWPPDRINLFLKKAGADQNGFTTDDFTCYTFFGRANDLEGLVQMEADRFQNLAYTVDVFKTESKAVLGEYNKSSSGTSLPLREKLREKVFGAHTYGHTTLGYLADIQAMPEQYEYSRTFFERFYTPDNTVVIAVGDFDPVKLEALVKTHYGAWNRKRAPSNVAAEPAQTAPVREHIEWSTPTLSQVSLSWRTPRSEFGSKDTAVFELLYDLLFGKTSPLYTRLVLNEQVVQRFADWSWHHRDPYLFHTVAYLKDRDAGDKVHQAIEAEIARLASGQLDEARLEAVKSHVRYGLLLHLTTADKIAGALAFNLGAGGTVNSLDLHLETIAEVNIDDVERFARLYLTEKNRSIVTLANKEAK